MLLIAVIATVGVTSSLGCDDEDRDVPAVAGPAGTGWVQSYRAGSTDSRDRYAGGSEILHLVGHRGRLYAACGYWMDARNIWYGGSELGTGWAQVLMLDTPEGEWEVDLEMGPFHLRPEILKSVTFTTDGEGNVLEKPIDLLLAGTYSPGLVDVDIHLFVRDDETATWQKSTVHTCKRPGKLGTLSVRDIHVYRDKVTGVDRIFITIGVLGVFSGVYDAGVPGSIRWTAESESGPVRVRPLAIIEANGSLLFSTGARIYRRRDGLAPTYEVVHDLSDIVPGKVHPAVGGIRGLSAIPNPEGAGESLLFVLGEGGRSQGCIYRLDPDGDGGYTRTREACLGELMSAYLDDSSVHYVLAGYNDIPSIVDPATGETVQLIGFESSIGVERFHTTQRKKGRGYYAGAVFGIRDANGKVRLSEVNGSCTPAKPVLVAARAIAPSPFGEDNGDVLYFGGHDCNFAPSHNTAWIFRTTLRNALRRDGERPSRLDGDK
jgi:hypothetical protein